METSTDEEPSLVLLVGSGSALDHDRAEDRATVSGQPPIVTIPRALCLGIRLANAEGRPSSTGSSAD